MISKSRLAAVNSKELCFINGRMSRKWKKCKDSLCQNTGEMKEAKERRQSEKGNRKLHPYLRAWSQRTCGRLSIRQPLLCARHSTNAKEPWERERKKERCRIMECVLYINNTPLFVPLFSGSDQCSCTARNAKNDSLPSSLLFLCVLACVVHKRGSPTPLPIACQYHKSYLSQHSKYIYFL